MLKKVTESFVGLSPVSEGNCGPVTLNLLFTEIWNLWQNKDKTESLWFYFVLSVNRAGLFPVLGNASVLLIQRMWRLIEVLPDNSINVYEGQKTGQRLLLTPLWMLVSEASFQLYFWQKGGRQSSPPPLGEQRRVFWSPRFFFFGYSFHRNQTSESFVKFSQWSLSVWEVSLGFPSNPQAHSGSVYGRGGARWLAAQFLLNLPPPFLPPLLLLCSPT